MDVARALSTLNTEEDEPRDLDLVDLRSALAMFADDYEPERLLEDVGGPVVSKAVAALLDTDKPVSKQELADLADVAPRSLSRNRDEFAKLEELGLLDIEAGESGKASQWRLQLPFRTERFDDNGPNPGLWVSRSRVVGVETQSLATYIAACSGGSPGHKGSFRL